MKFNEIYNVCKDNVHKPNKNLSKNCLGIFIRLSLFIFPATAYRRDLPTDYDAVIFMHCRKNVNW